MPSHALAPEVAGARHVTRLWIGTTWRDRSSGCRSHSLKDVPIVLPIVLWFLKFLSRFWRQAIVQEEYKQVLQDHAKRLAVVEAQAWNGTISMLRNNVSHNFDVAQHCADACWLSILAYSLGATMCYTLVVCLVKSWQRDTESRCMKKSRLDEPDEPGSASLPLVTSDPNLSEFRGPIRETASVEFPVGSVNPLWKRNDQLRPAHYKSLHYSQIDGNINGSYMQCRCLQGSGKAPQRCHWAGCWWLRDSTKSRLSRLPNLKFE